jgi:CheY-like chemotaxis protein
MTRLSLSPCFHPTTISILDDNEPFLRSLDLELPGHWACRTFTDPLVALEFLSRPVSLPPLMDRCFSLERQGDATAVVHLDLDMLEQEISHVQRFQRNSVVVVDYAMPSMNGLVFCATLEDPNIRKAMLTGVADEKLAVEAFNAGLIHRFIPKQTMDPITVLREFVESLIREYFNQHIERLTDTLSLDPPGFLVDDHVARFVNELIENNGLVEYYLVDNPPGLLMLKSSGEIWRLAILDEQQMRVQAEQARSQGAPEHIVRALSGGRAVMFYGGRSPLDYFGDEAFPWQEHCQPADSLPGDRGPWTVAVWKNAPGDIDFDPAIASYDAYLDSLD